MGSYRGPLHRLDAHLGAIRTIQYLERFYRWIGLDQCARWWVRHCLICQARKTSRQTVRWPVISMPLPNGPGEVISWDYLESNYTAEGTANILVQNPTEY